MDWNALVGGLIGAGIPALLVYVGLRRSRQSADAEAFGPAVLLLDRVNPDRLTINVGSDVAARMGDLQQQIDVARERLLVVAAGHPRRHVRQLARTAEVRLANVFHGSSWGVRDMQVNRDNPEWMAVARARHVEAAAALDALIEANFGWSAFGRRTRAVLAGAAARLRGLRTRSDAESTQAIGRPEATRQPGSLGRASHSHRR